MTGIRRSVVVEEGASMQFSQAAAAEAYLERKNIRGSLARWAEHCGFKPAGHHRMLIEYLEKVARGEIDAAGGVHAAGQSPKAPMPPFCFRPGCYRRIPRPSFSPPATPPSWPNAGAAGSEIW